MEVRRGGEAGLRAGVYPDRGKEALDAVVCSVLVEKEQDVEVRVEPVSPVGDFEGADRSLDAQELTELLASPAGRGSPPGIADLFQEHGQIIAQAVRHGQG